MSEKPNLQATQKWMQQILVSPLNFETDPSDYLPESLKGDVEKIIAPNSRLSGKERLMIYQTGYLARLRDCMEKQFVALKYALGDELFQAFTDDYLQRYPSESYTLSNLGDRFALFLEETRPDKDLPKEERETWPDFMIELVHFEYAINQIFDAQFDANFEYTTKHTADDQLGLTDGLKLFAFQFPVNQFYQLVVKENQPSLPPFKVSFTAILRKKDFRIGLFDLNEGQFGFLKLWQTHETFEATKQAFLQEINGQEEEFLNVWPQWKAYWAANGFFRKL